ncbi:MAG: hypothetical protein US49_C0001G0097 [candidate division TM6 bacterium GW2011_GWF2_37_49]|nr:MAG: hypothetical protein US49_C0001G0097 [candidate division TM6 bacterium GW2011_GWF2_37_49]
MSMKIFIKLKRPKIFAFLLGVFCGFSVLFPLNNYSSSVDPFSKTLFKFVEDKEFVDNKGVYVWECNSCDPFTELILSWNAFRPERGKMTFWVSVKHFNWSGWQRISEWGANTQRTFVNKLNPYVHTKHVRVEMQRGLHAKGFKIKVALQNGASLDNLKALFVCLSDLKKFKIKTPCRFTFPSVLVKGIPRHSQMVLNHPRYRELCSPTSTGLIVNYFKQKFDGKYARNLSNYLVDFADKVYDNGYLDIYGSWPLNVAQAYDATDGNVFYRVERLNSFKDLYRYISNEIPVAVSVRKLRGGATPYTNGHLMVVVGWDQKRQAVLCIDPAFSSNSQTPKAYKLRNFLFAWGRSNNLSYVPIPRDEFSQFV